MTTKTNLIAPRIAEAEIAQVDAIGEQCQMTALASGGSFQTTFMVAAAVQALRTAITDEMMQDIMALQGTRLGFVTDKDKSGGYDIKTVKECVIEATLRGFRPVGNEMNIIAGRFYGTKEGFERKVAEHPGLTDLRLKFGIPQNKNGGAVVECSAKWLLCGLSQSLEREIPVKVNAGMGVDAILGKATRKLLKAVYGHVTGSEHTMPDGDADDAIDAKSTPVADDLTPKLPTPKTTSPPKEEAPAESTPDLPDLPDQKPILDNYMKDFGKASADKSVIDAKKILARATDDRRLSSDSLWEIRRWGEECIGGIKDTRGENSNA